MYGYRIVFLDSSGKESSASSALNVTIPAGNGVADNTITLNNLPTSSDYSQLAIYRTEPGGTEYFRLATVPTGGSYTDTGATALSTQSLNTTVLNGNYSYMISYYRAGDPETRPSAAMGPVNIVNGRVLLSDFPAPPTPPVGGGFPAYDSIRIYRNTASDQNSFYLVDTIAPGQEYTDTKSDAEISNLATTGTRRSI